MERVSEGSGYINRIEWWKPMRIMMRNMGDLASEPYALK